MDLTEKLNKVAEYLSLQLKYEKAINEEFEETQDFDLFQTIHKYYDMTYDELFPVIRDWVNGKLEIPDKIHIYYTSYYLTEALMGINNPDFYWQVEDYLEHLWMVTLEKPEFFQKTGQQTIRLLKLKEEHQSLFQNDIEKYIKIIDNLIKLKIVDKKSLQKFKGEITTLQIFD